MNESNGQQKRVNRDVIDKFVLLGVLFLIALLFPFLGLVLGIALIWIGVTSWRSKNAIMNSIAMSAIFVGVIVFLMWILLLLGLTLSTSSHSEKTAPTVYSQELNLGEDTNHKDTNHTNQVVERSASVTAQTCGYNIVGQKLWCYSQKIDWSYNGSAITSKFRTRWGGASYMWWSFDGNIENSEQGGVGQSSYQSWTQGAFKYCPTKWSCLQHDYPCINQTVYGNGEYA